MPTRTKFLIGFSFLIIFVLTSTGLIAIYDVNANPEVCPQERNTHPVGDMCGVGDAFAIVGAVIALLFSLPFIFVLFALYLKNKIFTRLIFSLFLILTLLIQIGMAFENFNRSPYVVIALIVTLLAYYALLFNKRTLRYANFL